MKLDKESLSEVVVRLRRVQGQVGGIIQMIESGRECKDIVTQLAATSRALNRAGFKVVAAGLEQCLRDERTGSAQAEIDRRELEKLFLTLA